MSTYRESMLTYLQANEKLQSQLAATMKQMAELGETNLQAAGLIAAKNERITLLTQRLESERAKTAESIVSMEAIQFELIHWNRHGDDNVAHQVICDMVDKALAALQSPEVQL